MADEDLDTSVATLVASTTVSGDIVIGESDMITLGDAGVGLSTTASDIVVTAGDTITIAEELNARSNGNVTVRATGGDIEVNANVLSTAMDTGNLGDGSGTITLDSQAGTISTAPVTGIFTTGTAELIADSMAIDPNSLIGGTTLGGTAATAIIAHQAEVQPPYHWSGRWSWSPSARCR